MGLLKKAKNNIAYLKAGVYGDTGSGKSFTASLIAIGLHKFIKSEKPIAFFDTETGSNYLVHKFKKEGIELLQATSTALKDLRDVIDEAEKECDILIIDSITHVWREFTKAYQIANKRKFIQLWDWKPIKDEWYNTYTTRYNNSNLHIIMCGRAGSIYEDVEDTQNKGKMKSVKVGTKMNAETETGYEPGLLLEMEKSFTESKDSNGIYVRKCHVIKDRFDLIDSKNFNNPEFKNFLPHIQALNLGGDHSGIDATRTSEDMFDGSGDGEYYKMQKKRTICLEEITEEIKKYFPSSAAQEKAFRADLLEHIFNTRSWTAIENMDLLLLQTALKELRDILPEYSGEKTFKEFFANIIKTKTTEEPEIIPEDSILCPNSEDTVKKSVCAECSNRGGCPEWPEEEKDVSI